VGGYQKLRFSRRGEIGQNGEQAEMLERGKRGFWLVGQVEAFANA
jgi:hypothetical protein